MKIAFIVPSLINKGPIIVVDTLVRNLINQVEKVDLFYFDEKYGIDFVVRHIELILIHQYLLIITI